MINIENNDQTVVKELKRRNLYQHLEPHVKHPKLDGIPKGHGGVYALGDVKDARNKDVFLYFYGFPNPVDNGWQWMSLRDAQDMEIRLFDETVRQQVGEYEIVWQERS